MMMGVPNAATSGFPGNDLQILPIPMPNPEEARELENARIREEIFAVEIARRRFLEAALRLEIMYLEREMTMRRLTEQFGFQDRWGATPFGPRMPSVQYPFDERLARSSSFSAFNGSPFVPRLDTIAPELMPMSESNKDKLIVLVSLFSILFVSLLCISPLIWFLIFLCSLRLQTILFILLESCLKYFLLRH